MTREEAERKIRDIIDPLAYVNVWGDNQIDLESDYLTSEKLRAIADILDQVGKEGVNP